MSDPRFRVWTPYICALRMTCVIRHRKSSASSTPRRQHSSADKLAGLPENLNKKCNVENILRSHQRVATTLSGNNNKCNKIQKSPTNVTQMTTMEQDTGIKTAKRIKAKTKATMVKVANQHHSRLHNTTRSIVKESEGGVSTSAHWRLRGTCITASCGRQSV